MSTEWKQIAKAPLYEVSTVGDIRRVDNKKRVISHKDPDGYYRARLFNAEGKRITLKIHRIVAETFLENPLLLPTVDHISGKKEDNSLSNLRWADHYTQNQSAAQRHWREQSGGRRNVKLEEVNTIIELLAMGTSNREIERRTNRSEWTIKKVKKGGYDVTEVIK